MIKVHAHATEIEGDMDLVLSELTYAIYHVVNAIHEKTDAPIAEIESQLMDAVKTVRLAEAGMDMKEAHEIVTGVKIDKAD